MESQDGALILTAPELKVPVPDEWRRTALSLAGREIILGVRPEAILPSTDETGQLRAVVDVVEPMGSESYIYFRVGDTSFISRVDAHRQFRVGETAEPAVFIDKAHFFDCQTEQRI